MRTASVMSTPTLACTLLLLLLLLLAVASVMAVCPLMCSCGRGHRVVDCSARGLSLLPHSLQHNIHSLNLSHNRLQDLDGLLSHFAHLRTLDISYNHLGRLPIGLPRALWDVRASANRIRQLEKNDTAFHWNLQSLDLSINQLERVVFINNTLPSLRALNLSHNKFWTVPTNMPHNLEVVDLSYNFLLQILPGSLDRLPRLSHLYLHANRFASVKDGAFNQLDALQLLTLGDNPWACEDEGNMTSLLNWAQETSAKVLGCPCYIRPTCGEARLANTRTRHYSGSFTEPPLARNASYRLVHDATSGHRSKPALLNFGETSDTSGQTLTKGGGFVTSTAYGPPTQTSSTTTRTQSARKPMPGKARGTGTQIHPYQPYTVALNLLGTAIVTSIL